MKKLTLFSLSLLIISACNAMDEEKQYTPRPTDWVLHQFVADRERAEIEQRKRRYRRLKKEEQHTQKTTDEKSSERKSLNFKLNYFNGFVRIKTAIAFQDKEEIKRFEQVLQFNKSGETNDKFTSCHTKKTPREGAYSCTTQMPYRFYLEKITALIVLSKRKPQDKIEILKSIL